MSTARHLTRQKISTTIAPASLEYLNQFVASGEARNLADAIDLAINRLKELENRERLELDTASYFANLNEAEANEERRLELAVSRSAQGIDFEHEP